MQTWCCRVGGATPSSPDVRHSRPPHLPQQYSKKTISPLRCSGSTRAFSFPFQLFTRQDWTEPECTQRTSPPPALRHRTSRPSAFPSSRMLPHIFCSPNITTATTAFLTPSSLPPHHPAHLKAQSSLRLGWNHHTPPPSLKGIQLLPHEPHASRWGPQPLKESRRAPPTLPPSPPVPCRHLALPP